MQRTTSAILGLVLVIVLFFALNITATGLVRSMRLDLTENRIHTLSDGSRNITRSLTDRVNLTYYFSETVASGQPAIKQYGNRVRELLEEYERISGGRIDLEIIEPEPFSDQEDRAVADGVQPSQMPDGLVSSMRWSMAALRSFTQPCSEKSPSLWPQPRKLNVMPTQPRSLAARSTSSGNVPALWRASSGPMGKPWQTISPGSGPGRPAGRTR